MINVKLIVGNPLPASLFITINGRQALSEGPRKIGYCAYCKSQCMGLSTYCDDRVYQEARL